MVNGVGGPGGAGKVGGAPLGGAPVAPQPSAAERKGFGEALGGPGAQAAPGSVEGAARSVEATATPPLDRLRAGEIDLPRYVELRVNEATAHLEGVVPAADLEAIRAELHDVVEHDPDVAALAQAARIGS